MKQKEQTRYEKGYPHHLVKFELCSFSQKLIELSNGSESICTNLYCPFFGSVTFLEAMYSNL